jgi:hypothetical protein
MALRMNAESSTTRTLITYETPWKTTNSEASPPGRFLSPPQGGGNSATLSGHDSAAYYYVMQFLTLRGFTPFVHNLELCLNFCLAFSSPLR